MHHKYKYTTAQIPKCSNAPMLQCSNAQMLKCSNAQMLKCSNAQMLKCPIPLPLPLPNPIPNANANANETPIHSTTTNSVCQEVDSDGSPFSPHSHTKKRLSMWEHIVQPGVSIEWLMWDRCGFPLDLDLRAEWVLARSLEDCGEARQLEKWWAVGGLAAITRALADEAKGLGRYGSNNHGNGNGNNKDGSVSAHRSVVPKSVTTVPAELTLVSSPTSVNVQVQDKDEQSAWPMDVQLFLGGIPHEMRKGAWVWVGGFGLVCCGGGGLVAC